MYRPGATFCEGHTKTLDNPSIQCGTARAVLSDMSHTPGPWIVNAHRTQGSAFVITTPLDNWVPASDDAANARLIAAAPELLAALKALAADYKAGADSGDSGQWSADDQPVYQAAMVAIAKAEGPA